MHTPIFSGHNLMIAWENSKAAGMSEGWAFTLYKNFVFAKDEGEILSAYHHARRTTTLLWWAANRHKLAGLIAGKGFMKDEGKSKQILIDTFKKMPTNANEFILALVALENRLDAGEAVLARNKAEKASQNIGELETKWISILHAYEYTCDLAQQHGVNIANYRSEKNGA